MGSGLSTLLPTSCFKNTTSNNNSKLPELIFNDQLDETLGHSFCYVRSSNRFLSPTSSDRFPPTVVSPSTSLRFSPTRSEPISGFKSISGASVSANTWTPRTVNIYDDATDAANNAGGTGSVVVNVMGFESTPSFCALPLQPVPRGCGVGGCDVDRAGAGAGFFMSGPLERGAMSGPLDQTSASSAAGVHFSAPLNGIYVKKKRKKGISGIRKTFHRNFSEKRQMPWVFPVLNFVGKKENLDGETAAIEAGMEGGNENNVQWASGKAGEDRVHVVVSEEQGWFFVGIYDGFNGPDAPEFLMINLYRAVYNELQGLFWEVDEPENLEQAQQEEIQNAVNPVEEIKHELDSGVIEVEEIRPKRVTFEKSDSRRKKLWEYLAEDDPEFGLDLSGSERFAFSVDDAISVNNANAGSVVNRRWSLFRLKQGFEKSKSGKKQFPWKFWLEPDKEKVEVENPVVEEEEERTTKSGKRRKVGPVDHNLVLSALSRALEMTEAAYLDMTDKVLDTNPELALMGSCLLVALMRDEDVYVMNVGDSRAIVAQYEREECGPSSSTGTEMGGQLVNEATDQAIRLSALQLSTDHSTSIEEEIIRIKNEHPDDSQCIVNDRVKGRLKVTRAFGAGSLKQPKLNDALLEMFRNEYIGTAPYISCSPSLRHHRLCPRDQFLVLSSDGLYQYLTNQEVVSHVENFMEKFPDGDPAQHLIEEVLFRAAKKAGMDFHELLDIPQGDRRKYHDDVTVMVISLEGRIWKSSGKYL
ncbi:hypothetical protein ACFE04_012983 [Oxalis oulophora]